MAVKLAITQLGPSALARDLLSRGASAHDRDFGQWAEADYSIGNI